MELPTTVSLKSVYNNKYLRNCNDNAVTHGLLQFSADAPVGRDTQFDIVKAENSDGLVHIRNRLTSRYLIRWSPNHSWLTAWGNGQDENQSSWTCTLFKPIFIDENDARTIRLMHVQLGHYACLSKDDAPFDSCLFAGSTDPDQDSLDIFTVVDPIYDEHSYVEPDDELSFELMPEKYATFKSCNGKYLGPNIVDGKPYLQFSYDKYPRYTDDDIKSDVVHEIVQSNDGTVCIRSCNSGKYWRVGDENRVLADADDPRGTNNTAAMFRIAALKEKSYQIGLLNMETTKFCQVLTDDQVKDCMSATGQFLEGNSVLEMLKLDMLQFEVDF